MEEGEELPEPYTRQQLFGYLEKCRQRCRETISGMSAEQAERVCRFAWGLV
jgi:hypothetical protein